MGEINKGKALGVLHVSLNEIMGREIEPGTEMVWETQVREGRGFVASLRLPTVAGPLSQMTWVGQVTEKERETKLQAAVNAVDALLGQPMFAAVLNPEQQANEDWWANNRFLSRFKEAKKEERQLEQLSKDAEKVARQQTQSIVAQSLYMHEMLANGTLDLDGLNVQSVESSASNANARNRTVQRRESRQRAKIRDNLVQAGLTPEQLQELQQMGQLAQLRQLQAAVNAATNGTALVVADANALGIASAAAGWVDQVQDHQQQEMLNGLKRTFQEMMVQASTPSMPSLSGSQPPM